MRCEDFWIERVYVVADKAEKESFSFTNECRAWSGFVYCVEGEGLFINGKHKKFPFRSGDIVLLGRGNYYTIKMSGASRYITSALKLTTVGGEGNFPQIFSVSDDERNLIQEICRAFELKNKDGLFHCRILLTELYARFLYNKTSSETPNIRTEHAHRAAQFIQATFKENLSVSEIAVRCQIGESYLRSVFLREFGESITKFREKLRIREAKNMLRSGLFSNAEIAENLGYCDVYHFCKNFHKATGLPPGQYKKSLDTKI